MPFKIMRNDITKVSADAIVCAATPGELSPGGVSDTLASNLNSKYIINVSGVWWKDGNSNEADILKLCYKKALSKAIEKGCKSVAFPLLATDSYHFPKELGMQIAVDSFTSFLEENEMEIMLVVHEKDNVRISGELVGRVSEYIDRKIEYTDRIQEYTESAPKYIESTSEYTDSTLQQIKRSKRLWENTLFKSRMIEKTPKMEEAAPQIFKDETKPKSSECSFAENDSESLEDKLKEIYTDSFEKHLQQLINKKGLKNSEVYAAANLSKQYFSKLLKGQVKPSKEKMLALAVGLHLNMDETVDFLRIAGYALSPISQTDAVVEYFIEHQDYNVIKIDIVLFDYGLEPLTNTYLT